MKNRPGAFDEKLVYRKVTKAEFTKGKNWRF